MIVPETISKAGQRAEAKREGLAPGHRAGQCQRWSAAAWLALHLLLPTAPRGVPKWGQVSAWLPAAGCGGRRPARLAASPKIPGGSLQLHTASPIREGQMHQGTTDHSCLGLGSNSLSGPTCHGPSLLLSPCSRQHLLQHESQPAWPSAIAAPHRSPNNTGVSISARRCPQTCPAPRALGNQAQTTQAWREQLDC